MIKSAQLRMLVYGPKLAFLKNIHVSKLKLRKSGKSHFLVYMTTRIKNGLCVVSATTSSGRDMHRIGRLICIWEPGKSEDNL
jgi:hypothetical protein